jgi:APA family basic amino acid/polyamine antiporter
MANLWIRKSIEHLVGEADGGEKSSSARSALEPASRSASARSSARRLFVRTAAPAANCAGPSVTLGFVVAGVGCAFAGLCYAEFASMIPIAGSAYTYSYATMGELVAWIIGWDLVLEYASAPRRWHRLEPVT